VLHRIAPLAEKPSGNPVESIHFRPTARPTPNR
jgi:hypothetical protein